jgi:hypothetical protein
MQGMDLVKPEDAYVLCDLRALATQSLPLNLKRQVDDLRPPDFSIHRSVEFGGRCKEFQPKINISSIALQDTAAACIALTQCHFKLTYSVVHSV